MASAEYLNYKRWEWADDVAKNHDFELEDRARYVETGMDIWMVMAETAKRNPLVRGNFFEAAHDVIRSLFPDRADELTDRLRITLTKEVLC